MSRGLVVLFAFLTFAGFYPPAPAHADACGGTVGTGNFNAGGSIGCTSGNTSGGNTAPVSSSGGSAGVSLCLWQAYPQYTPISGEQAEGALVDGRPGHWYIRFCPFGQFATLADFEAEMASWGDALSMGRVQMLQKANITFSFSADPPNRPSAQEVMTSVVASLPFPQTFVAVNPVPQSQLVGVPTWVWLTDAGGGFDAGRYASVSRTLSLQGYALSWQIVPSVTVLPGDGRGAVSCVGAGVPWSGGAVESSACTVTYGHSGEYQLSASVGWTVRWSADGVAQPDLAGPRNTASQPVRVLESQAIVVAG